MDEYLKKSVECKYPCPLELSLNRKISKKYLNFEDEDPDISDTTGELDPMTAKTPKISVDAEMPTASVLNIPPPKFSIPFSGQFLVDSPIKPGFTPTKKYQPTQPIQGAITKEKSNFERSSSDLHLNPNLNISRNSLQSLPHPDLMNISSADNPNPDERFLKITNCEHLPKVDNTMRFRVIKNFVVGEMKKPSNVGHGNQEFIVSMITCTLDNCLKDVFFCYQKPAVMASPNINWIKVVIDVIQLESGVYQAINVFSEGQVISNYYRYF